MKKRVLKRFSATLCAFMICIFSVFGVSSLLFKKDNNVISASAETDSYSYKMNFFFSDNSANYFDLFTFSSNVLTSNYVALVIRSDLANITSYPRILRSGFSSGYNFDNFFIVERGGTSGNYTYSFCVNTVESSSISNIPFYIPLMWTYDNYFNNLTFVNNECVIPLSGLTLSLSRYSDLSDSYASTVIPDGSTLSVRIIRYLSGGGGYTQEDLDNARESGYNSGYTLGQMFGKIEGEVIGQNNAGVNSSELFAGVKANLYVRSGENLISSGLNVDVSQVVDDFYPNLPLWQLQITDGVISKDSTNTYVLELILPIYVKYPSNTLYLGAGANATGVVGRVTGVSGYLYPQKENYDGGIVTAPLPAGFETFYNIKSVSFSNPPTEDYYLTSVMISFTANPVRDSSFLLTLTTKELMNDYINTFNESYTTGEKVGYDTGKTVGYNEGVEDAHTYTFLNLMVAVIDAPIKSFTGMLDFEILGMNMQAFFLSLLTSALVLAAYRLFSGGKA